MELKELVDDFFCGGRKKSNEESQELYDLAQHVLQKLNGKSYYRVELFSEYLKEVSKDLSRVDIVGK